MANRPGNATTPKRVTFTSPQSWQGKLALELVCQEHAQEAINVLLEIMGDSQVHPKQRIEAAAQVLDRGYGTPVQRSVIAALTGPDSGTGYATMTTRQLLELALNPDNHSNIKQLPEGTPGIDFENGGE